MMTPEDNGRVATPGPAEGPGAGATLEDLLLDVARAVRSDPGFDARQLERIIHDHSARLPGKARFAKKQLMPFYLHVRNQEPKRWERWGIDESTERRLLAAIQMKPRRTASGVATITVITKPWGCSGRCLFCPNDVRMPKSYLHAEPACQRAERVWFDPYLQVVARLRALEQMGHATDKVELIVLGGTFGDYPEAYQRWFVHELFRALNDGWQEQGQDPWEQGRQGQDSREQIPHRSDDDTAARRRERYRMAGMVSDDCDLEAQTRSLQQQVDAGLLPFNAAIGKLYGPGTAWDAVCAWQQASMQQVWRQHARNENARRRCVGLVVETRPDAVDVPTLVRLRQLGCTKVQVGVQSLRQDVLDANARGLTVHAIARAFRLLRLFGFKIHAHFMVNLPGATPHQDEADYRAFVTEAPFQPDEVKLYPCALVESSALMAEYHAGRWTPYPEDVLVDVLARDVLATPPFTRISRMIRDFSAGDIVAGNKKTNLRQLVEARLRNEDAPVREIRFREVGTNGIDPATLQLEDIPYSADGTREHFLQWVAPDGTIAGFLRLSLPHADALEEGMPVAPGQAMIREVHVYGKVARLHGTGDGPQHLGLGKALVAEAERIARHAGYRQLNVISAVGTRAYYRKLGFHDAGLYLRKDLGELQSPLSPS